MAQAGFDVSLRDVEDLCVEMGMTTVKRYLDRAVSKDKMRAEEAAAVIGRIRGIVDLKEAAADADFVIEARG